MGRFIFKKILFDDNIASIALRKLQDKSIPRMIVLNYTGPEYVYVESHYKW